MSHSLHQWIMEENMQSLIITHSNARQSTVWWNSNLRQEERTRYACTPLIWGIPSVEMWSMEMATIRSTVFVFTPTCFVSIIQWQGNRWNSPLQSLRLSAVFSNNSLRIWTEDVNITNNICHLVDLVNLIISRLTTRQQKQPNNKIAKTECPVLPII